jgi:uncharacterized membrane protein
MEDPATQNLAAIARLEESHLERRTPGERLGEAIVGAIGTLWFVALQAALIAGWILLNIGAVPGLEPFDPFPFGILGLVVATEGVLLAVFILIGQNRGTRVDAHRDHLHLQVSLLAEREATKMLQILTRVAQRMGVAEEVDDESERLGEDTEVEQLASDVEERLTEG